MSDPNPARWRTAFRAHEEEAEALVARLSPEAFNHSPAEGAWSVGQCLDHLCEAGQQLVPALREALEEASEGVRSNARGAGRAAGGARPRLLLRDRLFVWMTGPNAWLGMPSPGAYRPAPGPLDPADTAHAFGKLQRDLAACADAADGIDWSAVRVASPANHFLRLSAGGWLAGTLAHQRRHLQQARQAA